MNTRLLVSAFLVAAMLALMPERTFCQGGIAGMEFVVGTDYSIEVRDGTTYLGTFIERTETAIVIGTASIPRIEIPIATIVNVRRMLGSRSKDGKYWFDNPNPTRYLFGPSAYSLKAGEGYYQNIYLVMNGVNVGITDNFSFGGGFEVISTFGSLSGGEFDPIFFLTPKFGARVSDLVSVGGGLLFVNGPGIGDADRSSFGVAYGIGSIGSIEHNATAGLGWGFVDGDFEGKPFITLSGMTRIGKHASLVSENWIIPTDGYYPVVSYGVRFFGETIAVDLAFVNSKDIIDFLVIGVPYVDFVVTF